MHPPFLRLLFAATLLGASALSLTGCDRKPSSGAGAGTGDGVTTRTPKGRITADTSGSRSAGAPGSAEGRVLKLAAVTNSASRYWNIARKGCEDAIQELGNARLEFRVVSTGNVEEQAQILENLLAGDDGDEEADENGGGADGIAVSPVDPANQIDVLNYVAEKTLLITLDSDAPQSRRVCYIGADNVAAGREAGKLLKQALPDGGRIMLFVGSLDTENARERLTGIREEIAGSRIEIIDVRTDGNDHVRAKTNAMATLAEHPDIAGLVGLWSYSGPAILSAVEESGLAGQVKIVCFDEAEKTLAGVAGGTIHGTVVQQPYEFGRQAILRMGRYLRGDASAFPENGEHLVPTLSITKENVEDFRAKLRSILEK